MCARVGNQRSRGVVLHGFEPTLFGAFIINVKISTNQLTRTSQKIGTHPTINHAKNIMTTTRPLKMLHMDLFGPIAYISNGGNKYGIVIIDDYSHFTWVFFLQDKSETQEVLKNS
jgi:hypothetical protein